MKIFSDKSKLAVLAILIMMSSLSIQKQIEVPAMVDPNPFTVKLGLPRIMRQPDFDFGLVYQRTVHEVRDDDTYIFPPCHESAPQIQFDIIDQIVFQGIPQKPELITNFQDMQIF